MNVLPGLLLLLPWHVMGQRTGASFTLTSWPMEVKVDKASFDRQYGHPGSEADYLNVLRRTFSGDVEGFVRYTMEPADGPLEFRVYHIPSARSRPAALTTLSSKSDPSSLVESRHELRGLLHDTIAIWDTLRIRIRPADEDLAPDGYYLLWIDPHDGRTYCSTVMNRADTLLFASGSFGTVMAVYIDVRLRHTALGKQDLAHCLLRPLSEREEEDLLQLVCDVSAEQQADDKVYRRQLLRQFCTDWYGHILADQLPAVDCTNARHP